MHSPRIYFNDIGPICSSLRHGEGLSALLLFQERQKVARQKSARQKHAPWKTGFRSDFNQWFCTAFSVRSVTEVTKYLLEHGVAYVLTNKFCQDPIEELFGRHRAIGRGADNMNLSMFR